MIIIMLFCVRRCLDVNESNKLVFEDISVAQVATTTSFKWCILLVRLQSELQSCGLPTSCHRCELYIDSRETGFSVLGDYVTHCRPIAATVTSRRDSVMITSVKR